MIRCAENPLASRICKPEVKSCNGACPRGQPLFNTRFMARTVLSPLWIIHIAVQRTPPFVISFTSRGTLNVESYSDLRYKITSMATEIGRNTSDLRYAHLSIPDPSWLKVAAQQEALDKLPDERYNLPIAEFGKVAYRPPPLPPCTYNWERNSG